MRTQLADTIRDIRGNRALVSIDEASTKAGVVLRLLSALGWDPFNVQEIKPEYAVGGKRVDYALRIGNSNKIFIEVKRVGEDLDQHQEQLLGYSFQEGVKLAILTNGTTWWFYLPLNEGAWEQRRFFMVDLFEQDPKDIAERFVEFLAKENVHSGEAAKNAERLYNSRQRKQILIDAIPKAWIKIVSDPDDLLVDLLIETTERMSGFRPEMTDVERFLKENVVCLRSTPPDVSKKIPNEKVTPLVSSQPLSKPPDDYINKRLQSFRFLGKQYQPKSWQELLLIVATELYQRHRGDFDKCLSLRGSKMTYFSKNPNELSYPKQIADSVYYAEVKLNSNSIVKRSRDLMSLFSYKEDDLQIIAE